MINELIWVWAANSLKNKSYINGLKVITILISILIVKYAVFAPGGLGVIPITLYGLFCFWCYGLVVREIYFGFEKRWQKCLIAASIIVSITGFVGACYIIRTHIISVDTDSISDVVRIDVFEGMNPPVAKKSILQQKGIPDNIDVEYDYDNEDEDKIDVLEYKRKDGSIHVTFINDEFERGEIYYYPKNMRISDILKDAVLEKKDPWKSYRIIINDSKSDTLEIKIRKNGDVVYMYFYNG